MPPPENSLLCSRRLRAPDANFDQPPTPLMSICAAVSCSSMCCFPHYCPYRILRMVHSSVAALYENINSVAQANTNFLQNYISQVLNKFRPVLIRLWIAWAKWSNQPNGILKKKIVTISQNMGHNLIVRSKPVLCYYCSQFRVMNAVIGCTNVSR